MHSAGLLYSESVRRFRTEMIKQALRASRGNQARAALSLGMHRNTFQRALVELDLYGWMREERLLRRRGQNFLSQ
jgi:DNA-binding NtrC family response regulator